MYVNKKPKKAAGFDQSLLMNNSFEDFSKVKKMSSRNNSITHYCNKLLAGQSYQTLYPKNFSISKHKKKATREIPSNLWAEVKQHSGQRYIHLDIWFWEKVFKGGESENTSEYLK